MSYTKKNRRKELSDNSTHDYLSTDLDIDNIKKFTKDNSYNLIIEQFGEYYFYKIISQIRSLQQIFEINIDHYHRIENIYDLEEEMLITDGFLRKIMKQLEKEILKSMKRGKNESKS